MTKRYLSFPYGDYEGEYLVYDKPHGKGTFKYFDGAIYKGEWKDGKYDGKGKLIFTEVNVLNYGNYKKWQKSSFRNQQLKIYKKYWINDWVNKNYKFTHCSSQGVFRNFSRNSWVVSRWNSRNWNFDFCFWNWTLRCFWTLCR